MVSLLGNYSFSFPRKMKPRYCANDFTSKGVNQWYYLSDNKIEQFYRYNEIHKTSNYLIETDEVGELSAPLEHYEE